MLEQFHVMTCVTAQHRELLDQVLTTFGVTPDYDLDLMRPGQTLYESTSRIIGALGSVVDEAAPDMILVQGDTTTAFCGALAGFYSNVPVGHVEAGLRTGDVRRPFPEEMNRVLTTRLASVHFAPTDWAADNLLREGIPADTVHITGNTGIDAVLRLRDLLESGEVAGFDAVPCVPGKKWIAVTAHRRESFGEPLERICSALLRLADRPDVEIVFPVHPNPNVQAVVRRTLGGHPSVHLVEPLDYAPFVDLMRKAYILLTDSGGVQEEGPALGKPVLVMRETTERPEGVRSGTVKLVGSDADAIVDETVRLLEDEREYERRAKVHSPYGDGHASERIAQHVIASSGRTLSCA